MEKKYAELYNINLNEIINFFGAEGKKVIAQMNVNSLGELIEVFESKEFITTFIRKNNHGSLPVSPVYQHMLGTIKILKLKYLGVDPNFSENDTLQELGFSTRAITNIMRSKGCYKNSDLFYANYNIIEVINSFSNKDFLINNFRKTRDVGEAIVTEIYLKAEILSHYFNNQKSKESLANNSGSPDFDLKELYQQLDELLKQQKKISEQIEIVHNLIGEKMSMEDKDGTNRKK